MIVWHIDQGLLKFICDGDPDDGPMKPLSLCKGMIRCALFLLALQSDF